MSGSCKIRPSTSGSGVVCLFEDFGCLRDKAVMSMGGGQTARWGREERDRGSEGWTDREKF